MAACRKHKAKLVIAKLDRLSRSLAFIATLMEAGIEFVAVDNPHANNLTVHILAAMAQYEREQISKRTRDALQAAKARGIKLGNPRIAEAAGLGVEAIKAAADQFAANVLPVIRDIQKEFDQRQRHCSQAQRAWGKDGARGEVVTHPSPQCPDACLIRPPP